MSAPVVVASLEHVGGSLVHLGRPDELETTKRRQKSRRHVFCRGLLSKLPRLPPPGVSVAFHSLS